MFSSWFSKAAAFPYELKEQTANFETVSGWTLHSAVRKADRKPVSILSFDIKKHPAHLPLALNAFRRMKTLRHPNLLPFLDGVEQEGVALHIVTEEVVPLSDTLTELHRFPHAISWGLHQLITGLAFLTGNGGLTYGNVTLSAVLVTKAGGDWKLAAHELVSARDDTASPLRTFGATLVPAALRPPELAKAAWTLLEQAPPYAADSWMLACLIYELYNGKLARTEDLKRLGNIPKTLVGQYQQLLSSNPSARLNPAAVLTSEYFNNVVVETCQFLEQITLKDQYDKDKFFRKLESHLPQLPETLCKAKILPQLVTALDFGGATSAIIAPLLHIAKGLNDAEYAAQITPSVVKWFATPNRELRLNLLQHLPDFVQHLPPALVNDAIFPSVATGFDDQSPVLREATVKSMLQLVPKLPERTVTTQVLKWLAKLQMDPEAGIRTNTTICLAKLAAYLASATRTKILAAAFCRALCDPFSKARVAGLMALQETQAFYAKQEIAQKLVPAIAPLTIDVEIEVRDEAFKALKLFIAKLERIAAHGEEQEAAREPDAAGASVLGWALSSLSTSISKKIMGDAKAAGSAQPGQIDTKNVSAAADEKTPVASARTAAATSGVSSNAPKTMDGKSDRDANDGWSDDDADDDPDESGWQEFSADFAASAKTPKSMGAKASSADDGEAWASSPKQQPRQSVGVTSTAATQGTQPRQSTQPRAQSSAVHARTPKESQRKPPADEEAKSGWSDDDDFFSSAAPSKPSSKLEKPRRGATKPF
eukprot:TRINITY_DN2518_c0_g1_i1.p1 TRINITY_DN2518_c0_g1~~TRINITY_DN2518_c0_g1_i1.p1  ORF type:complete len:767 (-),score=203.57 TRINITY_DN2518_c0_g1_i1:2137-4437(-)